MWRSQSNWLLLKWPSRVSGLLQRKFLGRGLKWGYCRKFRNAAITLYVHSLLFSLLGNWELEICLPAIWIINLPQRIGIKLIFCQWDFLKTEKLKGKLVMFVFIWICYFHIIFLYFILFHILVIFLIWKNDINIPII